MKKTQSDTVSNGITWITAVGIAVAVQISWAFNESVGWAIWHGFLNWLYIAYRVWFAGLPS